MRAYIVTIFILLNCSFASGQRISVSCDKMNIVYVGVDNPLTIIAENVACKDLLVKTSIGEVIEDSCHYTFKCSQPELAGSKVLITVSKKLSGQIIELRKLEFRLKNVTNPIAVIKGKSGGRINLEFFQNADFLKLILEGFDAECNFHVESFTLSILRGDSCFVNNIINSGDLFNNEIKKALQSLKSGDTVIFKQIICKEKRHPVRDINPIIFFVE